MGELEHISTILARVTWENDLDTYRMYEQEKQELKLQALSPSEYDVAIRELTARLNM